MHQYATVDWTIKMYQGFSLVEEFSLNFHWCFSMTACTKIDPFDQFLFLERRTGCVSNG